MKPVGGTICNRERNCGQTADVLMTLFPFSPELAEGQGGVSPVTFIETPMSEGGENNQSHNSVNVL